MKEQGKLTKLMAKFLVLALFVGVFAAIPSATAQAATNKAMQMKVSFNGKRDSAQAYNDNIYGMLAGYKKTAKVKKNMSVSGKVYVPVSALKKSEDSVHVDVWLDLCNKKGDYIGAIDSKYTIILTKEGKKVSLVKWNKSKEKIEKIGSLASYKKSNNYYVITLKNVPIENKYINTKDKKVSLNTKTTYNLNQGIIVTGTCSKVSKKYIYVDDLMLKGTSTQKITFNKKDYTFVDGFYKDKARTVKVTAIK